MRERGYSLVDLLIVVVMGGVLVALAGPSVTQYQRRTAVRTTADQFMATQLLARSFAMKYGRLAQLHLDNSTSRYWVEVDTAGSGVPDTIGHVRDPARDGVQLTSSLPLICYDASGSASGRGACSTGMVVVAFAAHGYADTVWVTTAGNALR
ncbi:MAG: pilus assembly FimT family protein [Gemmatimonadota bacterium]